MMRRGFLGAIVGSPIAARAAINAGMAENSPLDDFMAERLPVTNKPSKVVKSAWSVRDKIGKRRELRNPRPDRIPQHIRSKKSWSGAFKVYAYAQEEINRVNLWDLSDEELVAHFVKRGLLGE